MLSIPKRVDSEPLRWLFPPPGYPSLHSSFSCSFSFRTPLVCHLLGTALPACPLQHMPTHPPRSPVQDFVLFPWLESFARVSSVHLSHACQQREGRAGCGGVHGWYPAGALLFADRLNEPPRAPPVTCLGLSDVLFVTRSRRASLVLSSLSSRPDLGGLHTVTGAGSHAFQPGEWKD